MVCRHHAVTFVYQKTVIDYIYPRIMTQVNVSTTVGMSATVGEMATTVGGNVRDSVGNVCDSGGNVCHNRGISATVGECLQQLGKCPLQ